MSAIDINLTSRSEEELLTEHKQKQESRAELKARLVTVYSRGVVGDRLSVPLPDDLYGEWVPADKMEVYRMESMGFKIDTEHASKRALHDDGTGGESRIADVVFMTCPKETKEIIEEIKREQYNDANSPRGGKQKEERDFAAETRQVGLPDATKSRVENVNIDNIRSALNSKD